MPEERIDVETLMQEVRQRARRIRGSDEPEARRGAVGVADLLASYNLLDVPVASPRVGVGRIIGILKLTLRRLLQPVLHQQTVFNEIATQLLREALAETVRLRDETARIVSSAEETARRLQQTERRLGELVLQFTRLVRREEATLPPPSSAPAVPTAGAVSSAIGAGVWDRSELQERFRGPEHEIRRRQREYVTYFDGAGEVLDVGCGRGEFLELLRERGVSARGIDSDLDAVLHCRDKGLDVIEADLFDYLRSVTDESLGGIFCAQVIEHVPPARGVQLIALAIRKLRRDGVVLLETPNPQCLTVFAQAFFLDPTHVWPYHPELLKALLELEGFADVRLIFSSPVDRDAHLPQLEDRSVFGADTQAYNRAATWINRILLGSQDYAAVGWKRGSLA